MDTKKEIKQSKSLTILISVALLVFISIFIFLAISTIANNPKSPVSTSANDVIPVFVLLTVVISVFTWAFINQVKEYMKLLYDVQKEKLFDEFAGRLNELIESKKLEISVKETEEKLQNIGAI